MPVEAAIAALNLSHTLLVVCCNGGLPFVDLHVWPLDGATFETLDPTDWIATQTYGTQLNSSRIPYEIRELFNYNPDLDTDICDAFNLSFSNQNSRELFHYRNGSLGCRCPAYYHGLSCQLRSGQMMGGGGNSFKIFLYLCIIPLGFALLAAIGGFMCKMCCCDCFSLSCDCSGKDDDDDDPLDDDSSTDDGPLWQANPNAGGPEVASCSSSQTVTSGVGPSLGDRYSTSSGSSCDRRSVGGRSVGSQEGRKRAGTRGSLGSQNRSPDHLRDNATNRRLEEVKIGVDRVENLLGEPSERSHFLPIATTHASGYHCMKNTFQPLPVYPDHVDPPPAYKPRPSPPLIAPRHHQSQSLDAATQTLLQEQ